MIARIVQSYRGPGFCGVSQRLALPGGPGRPRRQLLPPPLLRQMLTTFPGSGYGLGVMAVHTPCGGAWGHDEDFPGYFSNAFTTRGDAWQAIVLVNSDVNGITQEPTDAYTAVVAGLCGHL